MEPSLFKSVDYAAKKHIEKENVAICLANEKDVRICRMCVHRSDSSVLLAYVLAEFAGHSLSLETIDKNFASPSIAIFFLDILLEAGRKMSVSAVPANVRAGIRVSFSASSGMLRTDAQCREELYLTIKHFPQTTSSIFCSSCP